jgi:hypothetical protein
MHVLFLHCTQKGNFSLFAICDAFLADSLIFRRPGELKSLAAISEGAHIAATRYC